MQKTVQKFFKAEPSNVGDVNALHRFRIRGKELRYAMELLAAAFPVGFRDELYPVVEQLQELLGDIIDHATDCRNCDRCALMTNRPVSHGPTALVTKERRSKLRWPTMDQSQ